MVPIMSLITQEQSMCLLETEHERIRMSEKGRHHLQITSEAVIEGHADSGNTVNIIFPSAPSTLAYYIRCLCNCISLASLHAVCLGTAVDSHYFNVVSFYEDYPRGSLAHTSCLLPRPNLALNESPARDLNPADTAGDGGESGARLVDRMPG